jgi:hypothetical protein
MINVSSFYLGGTLGSLKNDLKIICLNEELNFF